MCILLRADFVREVLSRLYFWADILNMALIIRFLLSYLWGVKRNFLSLFPPCKSLWLSSINYLRFIIIIIINIMTIAIGIMKIFLLLLIILIIIIIWIFLLLIIITISFIIKTSNT